MALNDKHGLNDESDRKENISTEIKTGRQLAEVYLIIFSFLMPSSFDLISKSKNPGAILAVFIFCMLFVMGIITYISYISKIDNLWRPRLGVANISAIMATMCLGFMLSLYFEIYLQVNGVFPFLGNNAYFFWYIFIGTMFSFVFASSLFLLTPIILKIDKHEGIHEGIIEFNEVETELSEGLDHPITCFIGVFRREIVTCIVAYCFCLLLAIEIFKPSF